MVTSVQVFSQPEAQSVMVQVPVPVQVFLQSFPGHLTDMVNEPSAVLIHFPPAQSRLAVPVPLA